MIKNILVAILFLGTINLSFGQNIWTKVSSEKLEKKEKVRRSSFPNKAKYYKLDLSLLKNILSTAPERFVPNTQALILEFPNAEGTLEKFKVVHSPIMHKDLAAKYPMIKTYAAQGIDDPTAFMRFSVTQFGLHTMALSGTKSTTYIDPYTEDRAYYIVYDKKSLGKDAQGFECLTDESAHLPSLENDRASFGSPKAVNDQKFRIFRLAQSCTAEYGNIFATNAGTELADIQAQMTISINRVNTVYEIDLAIQLQFVANNDQIIYFGNTNSDPWDGEWNTMTAQTIDAAIGVNNYDIGHNFNAQGGGNAGCIGCVCLSNSQTGTHKGRGYTGRSNPTGDPFDIDYVAHEMGHQFGGYHTQSNQSCRSGSGQTEVEPGSGSSIMGYAGICADNVQGNSDAHFNYVNIRDISANIKAGGNSTCANEITTTNNPPTADAGSDYVIPKSTAFILEGTATDADGLTSLTYNWSQNDPENPNTNDSPVATRTVGPMYRSILPAASPNRYMPDIAQVLVGNLTPTWEVTPSVARNMEFAFTVRDNELNGAQTADDLMSVTVSGSAGPFEVTSQNTTQNWIAGQTKTVTWNVAGTNTGAVNTPKVDIFLSLDGGFTYPVSLAAAVPNNGSANVVIPGNAIANNCRIMVRGHNNIFYALNEANIAITPGDFIVNYSSAEKISCNGDQVVYNFTYTPQTGFVENTAFSISNLPAGANAVFSPTSASTTTSVSLTISNLGAVNVGVYNLLFSAAATSSNQTQNLVLEVAAVASLPNLIAPTNAATNVATDVSFNWSPAAGNSVNYTIEIATDLNFTSFMDISSGLTNNTHLSNVLANGTTYYWRVKTINECGESLYSEAYSFTTSSCSEQTSLDVPIAISSFGTPTISSAIEITTAGIINDLNVVDIIGQHTRVGHLTVSLTSPAGTTVVLWGGICGTLNDFDLNFDDAAATANIPCPPTTGLAYIPQDALATFNGENALGTWTLTVADDAWQGGGSLDNWALEICFAPSNCLSSSFPVITATKTPLCEGENAILVVNGSLNDAAYWQWYTGSCGGTLLGTGNNISVSPTVNTNYFVRGEGGCLIVPGVCNDISITVNPTLITNQTIVESTAALINGNWYYVSQNVEDVYSSALGCDSIVKTKLIIENPTGIYDLQAKESKIKLYPNPNNGSFQVDFDFKIDKENEIVIYNMLGQIVYRQNNLQAKGTQIHLEQESKGVYYFIFKSETAVIKKDIVLF